MKIYLSGPMTGYPEFNSTEFKRYAAHYRARGWEVFSPPETDDGDWTKPYAYYIKRDILALVQDGVERIYLLPNWHQSKGALLEKHIGETIGLGIWDVVTDLPWAESTAEEAHRLVHGPRGSAYGHPLDDMGRTAGMLNSLLKDVLRWELNARDVWQIMACVKLSRERNSPKRDNRVDLGGYAETGEMIENEAQRRGVTLAWRVPVSAPDRECAREFMGIRTPDPARKEDTPLAQGTRQPATYPGTFTVSAPESRTQLAFREKILAPPCGNEAWTADPNLSTTAIPYVREPVVPLKS